MSRVGPWSYASLHRRVLAANLDSAPGWDQRPIDPLASPAHAPIRLILEGKYHYVTTDSEDLYYVPITIGYRW